MIAIVFAAVVVSGLEPLVTCEDWRGWTHAVQVAEDGGRAAVTIRLTSPTNTMPPPFGVQLRVSGAGVQNQPSEVIYAGDFGFHKGIMDTVVVKGVE